MCVRYVRTYEIIGLKCEKSSQERPDVGALCSVLVAVRFFRTAAVDARTYHRVKMLKGSQDDRSRTRQAFLPRGAERDRDGGGRVLRPPLAPLLCASPRATAVVYV